MKKYLLNGVNMYGRGIVMTLALALLLPVSAPAQSVTLEDLVGAWANREYSRFYIYPDSTYGYRIAALSDGEKQYHLPPEWRRLLNYLRGDTLSFWKFWVNRPCNTAAECPQCFTPTPASNCYSGEPGYLIVFKDKNTIDFVPLENSYGLGEPEATETIHTYRRVVNPSRLVYPVGQP